MSEDQENEKHCTILINFDKGVPPTAEEIQKKLEHKKDSQKAEALEELVLLMINGESYPKLLMSIIRFVVTSNDHRVKKLLMIYWEVVDKCKENGDLKEEMILVCNALRNDLMHANEYVRGSTLRVLSKMKYLRIIEPLKEAIVRNLSHRHSYVRRNAVMCVFAMIKQFGPEAIPDAIEEVENLLVVEGDLSTKRNAFLMLSHCDQDRAVKYLLSMQEQVGSMGDIFQLATLELIRKVCRQNSAQKGRFLRIVFDLATSSSTAVSYDCATSLVSLTTTPLAVNQATQSFVQLLTEQSDNNIKLIVLDRLREVQKKHPSVMESKVMDIMRALGAPSLDVRKKVLDICLGTLVTQRNVKDVVGLLKKEVGKTAGHDGSGVEGNTEYRRMLIKALHATTAQYPEHAKSVMFQLMEFLTESDQATASEVVMFLRELIANFADMRASILQRLADSITDISQPKVLRGCLWLFGEYCDDADLLEQVIQVMIQCLRPLPLVMEEKESEKKKDEKKEDKGPAGRYVQKTVVLADGTYATQNVWEGTAEEGAEESKSEVKKTPMRGLILGGDFLLISMYGVALTKLATKCASLTAAQRNEVLFVLANLMKLVREHFNGGESNDSAVRLSQCIKVMVGSGDAPSALTKSAWGSGSGRTSLAQVLALATQSSEWSPGAAASDEPEDQSVPVDTSIMFRQLREKRGAAGAGETLEDFDDFAVAKGMSMSAANADGAIFAERLAKVQQMTGLADTVYVEAFLQVHGFDLVLELFLVNRSTETLQNVQIDLSTQGDLKLIDRPSAVTLAPEQQVTVNASIKVGSTETGIIFGYVSYDKSKADEKEVHVLNELHVDILDYIQRAWIGEMSFRSMWQEFEWENKIIINTSLSEVGAYLRHIMKNTNMSIVGRNISKKAADAKAPKKTPGGQQAKFTDEEVNQQIKEAGGLPQLIQSSSFVAVNLYAKSIFGEDALANISIEKLPEGKLTGSIRIRSRTQGIALSLGDRITLVQRGGKGSKK
jgi:coatomer subunit beta